MKIDVENPQAVLEDILTRINRGELVEVVRCKDCEYCEADPFCVGALMCVNEQWYSEIPPTVEADAYCSYGERRTKGENR